MKGFKYRTVLGCWINDLASVPRIEQWPSIKIDQTLEQDLNRLFDTLKEVKLNSVILFGLLASKEWEPDFQKTVSPKRKEAVKRILSEAGRRGIKVLYGLGLYSWGFEKIIREDPGVRGSNPQAMCGSKEASHEKMAGLIDYLLSTFPFDGFHFESADQGRCSCPRCKKKGDAVYHLELNERMAKYVCSRWPGKIVEVYVPIGFTPEKDWSKEDWLQWREASKHFTFLIDDWNRADRFGCESRKEIISALSCAYGTRSSMWVYPPQRWEKLQWFIPIIEKRASHYRKLAEDGGQAVMIQGSPLINPGEEMTLRCSGKFAQDPFRSVCSILRETVEEMFRPRKQSVTEELADIFWWAEKAYFANANFYPEGGELHLEPLCGKIPGPPIYLQQRFYSHNLQEYETAITNIRQRFLKIRKDIGDQKRAACLQACLNAVLHDIARIKTENSTLRFPASTTDKRTWTDKWLWGK